MEPAQCIRVGKDKNIHLMALVDVAWPQMGYGSHLGPHIKKKVTHICFEKMRFVCPGSPENITYVTH